MKTRIEMNVEVAIMNTMELKDLIERLQFNKRESVEEERMLETAKNEVIRRFLGTEQHYIDNYGVLRKKVEVDEFGCPLVNGVEQIWFE